MKNKFIHPISDQWQLKTPVAFIIFNRPDLTRRVFDSISRAKPPYLLLIGDGPRLDRDGEVEKVMAAREIVGHIDWPCRVLTNFSEINLGCKTRVSTGIEWVFSLVEEAIFLEDDCLPDPSFFRFCEEMLDRYRNNPRIGMVSGDNFLGNKLTINESYYFSKYFHIWGWATWRDRWCGAYDASILDWPRIQEEGLLTQIEDHGVSEQYWGELFTRVYKGEINTWDYQWTLANWKTRRVSIMPKSNLISNIGFGFDATHTRRESPLANLPTIPMTFPLSHPKRLEVNNLADKITERDQFTVSPLKRILKSFRHILKS